MRYAEMGTHEALTIDECKQAVIDFCQQYPIALKIAYVIRNKQEDALGIPEATKERVGNVAGAYFPARRRVALAVSNLRDARNVERTLRHELLGHLGINTFTARDKRALLARIAEAREQPGLAELWRDVEREYPRDSVDRQAEEVFASVCEVITPERFHRAPAGQAAFAEVCEESARPMTAQDLVDIATVVADGLHRRERRQQIFPVRDNDQFCEGTFVGPILGIEGSVAMQRINRQGEIVMHSLEALASPVKLGDLVEIHYRGGLGQVAELGATREMGR
ncbi:TPA: KfrB domain-containing protein [Burkholderia lata]